jgi:putative thioredoxin
LSSPNAFVHPFPTSYARTFWTSNYICFQKSKGIKSDFKDLDAEEKAPPVPQGPPPKKQPAQQIVIEVNEANFELAVMNQPLPVLLECYSAPMSAANRPLAEYSEVLRQTVMKEEGYVLLARLDVSTNMALAQDLRVTQVPTALALVGGRAYNVVPGIPSKETITKLINGIMAMGFAEESQYILNEADTALKANDLQTAAKQYSELISIKRYHMEPLALTGLAQVALKENNLDAAKQLVDQVKEKYPESSRIARVKQVLSEVELATSNVKTGNETELLKKIEENPKDWESRYEFAVLCQSKGNPEEAMKQLFEIVRGEREWNNKAARLLLIKIFDSLGEDNEVAIKGRKRLNNLWFL